MRCSKKLIEDRGICADCEVLFLDDAVRLKQALEVALRDERIMLANLTSTQARCTELLEENRVIRRQYEVAIGVPPLGASRARIVDAIAKQVGVVLLEHLPAGGDLGGRDGA
jgi:hypothetical protein